MKCPIYLKPLLIVNIDETSKRLSCRECGYHSSINHDIDVMMEDSWDSSRFFIYRMEKLRSILLMAINLWIVYPIGEKECLIYAIDN